MKQYVALLLAAALLLTALPALSEAPEEKALTLMVYMCGSNLESRYGSASADIDEMLFSEVDTRRVNLLVMTGGSEAWRTEQDAGTTRISRVRRGQLSLEWESEALNMGDPSTLTALLKYGVERYPAEKYALILWDHGAGPLEGVCYDELNDPDRLSLDELAKALEVAPLPGKLSWIGFDACLMSTLEVASRLAPYAEYMIASQETEPAAGWNYAFLAGLADDAAPEQTARRIVDGYLENEVLSGDTLTMACLDLSRTQAVVDALGACFAPRAQGMDETRFIKLAGLRARTSAFGEPLKAAGIGGYDLVDLEDLIQNLEADDPAGAALKAALEDMVVYSRSNKAGANGVSIYHPCYNKERFREEWRRNYGRLGFSPAYERYINAYGSYLLGEELADWSGLGPVETGVDGEGRQTFALKLNGNQAEHFASAQLLILIGVDFLNDGLDLRYSLVGSAPAALREDGTLCASYDGRALYLISQTGEAHGPLGYVVSSDGKSLVTDTVYIPVGGGLGDSGMQSVYYYVSPPAESGAAEITQIRVKDEVTGALTNRLAFSEDDYRGMYLWYPLKDAPRPDDRGLLPAYTLWDDYREGLAWENLSLPDDWHFEMSGGQQTGDQLWAVFEVTDVQQNTWCTPPIPVENPNLRRADIVDSAVGSEDIALTLEATADLSDSTPRFRLVFRIENLTPTVSGYQINDIVLNGKRHIVGYQSFIDVDDRGSLDISRAGTCAIDLEPRDLAGLDALETLSCTLRVSAEGEETYVPAEFTFRDCDLGGIALPIQPLAAAEQDGVALELLSLEHRFGAIDMVFHVDNRAAEDLSVWSGHMLVNDSLQLPCMWMVDLPPVGMDEIQTITVLKRDELGVPVTGFKLDASTGFLTLFYLPDLLRVNGVTEISRIELYVGDNPGGLRSAFRMTLDAPDPVPPADPPIDDLASTLITLYDDAAEPRTLARGADLEVSADHFVVGENGLILPVTLHNAGDRAIRLTLEAARINGQPVTPAFLYTGEIVAPGATATTCLLLDMQDDLPEGLEIETVELALTCADGAEAAWATLRFPEGTALSAPGGTILTADALEIEPAALAEASPE